MRFLIFLMILVGCTEQSEQKTHTEMELETIEIPDPPTQRTVAIHDSLNDLILLLEYQETDKKLQDSLLRREQLQSKIENNLIPDRNRELAIIMLELYDSKISILENRKNRLEQQIQDK